MSFIETRNPATEEICGVYPLMNQNDVDAVICEMHDVQKTWAKTTLLHRSKCLSRAGELIMENKQEYVLLMTREMGKPLTQSVAEIEKCSRLCAFYAEQGAHFLEPEVIQTEYYKSYRSFQPLGIIFAIMPWNFPFWQVMRFAVPNLIVGNAGLLKHAPNSTGTALVIEELFLKAGFPKNLFRSLVMDVSLAPFVIQHPKVAGVTLTGSERAGRSVAQHAGAALKKVVLELGGSDPYVVLEDADLELAVRQCVASRLNNAGQVCIAAKRIIVVEHVKQAFEDLLLARAKEYVLGDPLSPETNIGPMAREDLRDNLHLQVGRTIQAGARCLLGGVLPRGKGFYYPVTVLTDVKPDSPAFHEELFGPVICITSADNEAHALNLANQSEYGLSGAVFTQDLARGERIARDIIEVGTCAVNTLVASDPRLPFGGIKHSGFGRELSVEGMREFVNIKTVIVAS